MGASEKYADEELKESEDVARSAEVERKALRRVIEVLVILLALNTTIVLLFTTVGKKNRDEGGAADLFGVGVDDEYDRRRIRCETVHVFGGDTAEGGGASAPEYSWVDLLATELGRRGVAAENHAASGATSAETLSHLESALGPGVHNASCALVSLSLTNEGLFAAATDAESAYVADSFLETLAVDAAYASAHVGGVVVLGSPYPNSMTDPIHLDELLRINARLKKWTYPTGQQR